MSLPWWSDGSLLWDTLLVGGRVVPGVSALDGDVERKLDVQPVLKKDGATIKDQGYIPKPIKIATKIWLQEQWDDWQTLLPTIHPRTVGGLRQPLDIIHPAANLLGIRTIYVNKIGMPKVDNTRAAVIAWEAIQWFPAPKAARTSNKPKNGGAFDPGDFDVPGPGANGGGAVNF